MLPTRASRPSARTRRGPHLRPIRKKAMDVPRRCRSKDRHAASGAWLRISWPVLMCHQQSGSTMNSRAFKINAADQNHAQHRRKREQAAKKFQEAGGGLLQSHRRRTCFRRGTKSDSVCGRYLVHCHLGFAHVLSRRSNWRSDREIARAMRSSPFGYISNCTADLLRYSRQLSFQTPHAAACRRWPKASSTANGVRVLAMLSPSWRIFAVSMCPRSVAACAM